MDHEHNADINDLLSEFRKQHEENSVAAHWAQVDALPRRVVQLAVNHSALYALCSDGTVWGMSDSEPKWFLVPAIPQDKPKADLTGGVGLGN